MNMISTGSFLTEMDASNKQETLAEKFAAVWEKKNSKVARAGGVSLMALSLAACGSDDETADAGTGSDAGTGTDTGTDTGADTGTDTGTEAPAPTTPVAVALVGGEDTTGTAGADSYTATTTGLTSTSNFRATDDIDGGAGADSLALTLGANFAGFTTTGTDTGSMTGIETVTLTSSSSTARTFDATGVSGVETYKIDGAEGGVVSITDSADLAAIELSNIATGAFSVAYAAPTGGTSPVAGSADTLNLSIAGLGSSTADISVTAAGVETLAITSNAPATAAGTTNYVDVSGVSGATSTTVAGAANTDVAAVSKATTSFDASASTGDVTVDLTNAATGALASVKTGAGADKVTTTFADYTLTATTDLGEGSDTLVISGAGGNASAMPTVSGVETLDLSGMTGIATLSMKNATGITDIVLGDGTASDATPFAGTINLVSETEARNFDLIGAATGTITTDTAKAVDVDMTADADATAIAVNTSTATVTADTAASLDVSISGHVDYNGTVSADAAKSVTLTTADTAQAFAVEAGKAETVNITAGKNLTLNGTTDVSSAVDVDIATSGAFQLSSGAAASLVAAADIDLSGASTKSSVTVDELIGATDLGYDMDITATGLQAGLTLTGGVDSGTGNLTITATDVLGAVNTGAVATDATFTFNASTLGANTLGTVAAKTAVINASNAVAGLTDGTMTIGSKATINGPATSAVNTAINGSGTSLTVALDLGTGDDTITIGGAAKTKTYTVTGDTGRSADDIDITVADYTTDTTSTVTVDVSGLTKNTDAADEVVIDISAEATNDKVVIKGSTDTDDELAFGAAYNGVTNTVEFTITNVDTVTFGTTLTLTTGSLSGVETTLVGATDTDSDGEHTDAVTLTGVSTGETLNYSKLTIAAEAVDDFTVNAGGGDDTITGTDNAIGDTLNGQDGDDTITGGEGADVIAGGAGDDTIILTEDTAATDVVILEVTAATNGEDTITGFATTSDDISMLAFEDAVLATYAGAASDSTAATHVDNTVYLFAAVDAAGSDGANAETKADVLAGILALDADGAATAGAADGAYVVTDADSTAVWYVSNAGAGAIDADSLTLMATIDAVLVSGDIVVA